MRRRIPPNCYLHESTSRRSTTVVCALPHARHLSIVPRRGDAAGVATAWLYSDSGSSDRASPERLRSCDRQLVHVVQQLNVARAAARRCGGRTSAAAWPTITSTGASVTWPNSRA